MSPLRLSGLNEVHHRHDKTAAVCTDMAMRKTLWGLRHIWYCIIAEYQQADVRCYQKAVLSGST